MSIWLEQAKNCTSCINIQALFENFKLDVCNGLDMCRGWKRISWQENFSLQARMDIERKEGRPRTKWSDQLASTTAKQQQQKREVWKTAIDQAESN
uniref:Uncharacterized protein n=1 Tax=Megaselia scalaris TaxID=36166 RepID=T1GNZ3_MEGSC